MLSQRWWALHGNTAQSVEQSMTQRCDLMPYSACWQEYTNYHFDVKPEKLHGALDRFAQFFIEPLCKAEALEREVQAVNNEFVGARSELTRCCMLLPLTLSSNIARTASRSTSNLLCADLQA